MGLVRIPHRGGVANCIEQRRRGDMYSSAEVGVHSESIALGPTPLIRRYHTCVDLRLQSTCSTLKSPVAAARDYHQHAALRKAKAAKLSTGCRLKSSDLPMMSQYSSGASSGSLPDACPIIMQQSYGICTFQKHPLCSAAGSEETKNQITDKTPASTWGFRP